MADMLLHGIDTWAPTVAEKTVVVDFSSPNVAKVGGCECVCVFVIVCVYVGCGCLGGEVDCCSFVHFFF